MDRFKGLDQCRPSSHHKLRPRASPVQTDYTGNFQLELKSVLICPFNCWNSPDDQSFPFDLGPLSAAVAFDRGDKFSGNRVGRVLSTHDKYASIQRSVSQLVPKIPVKKSDLLGWGLLKQRHTAHRTCSPFCFETSWMSPNTADRVYTEASCALWQILVQQLALLTMKNVAGRDFCLRWSFNRCSDPQGTSEVSRLIENPKNTKLSPWFQLRWGLSASSGISGPLLWC